MKEKELKKWIFWFTFAVASIVVYKTIDSVSVIFAEIGNLLSLLMPFIMAVIIAYMLYIPCKSVEQTYIKSKSKIVSKHARGLSVCTIYLILILIIFIIINFIVPTITESLKDLAQSLPNYYNSTIEFLDNVSQDSIWAKLNIVDLVSYLQEFNFAEKLVNWLDLENITQYLKGIVGVAKAIFNIFVTVVVSVYLLLERNDIKNFIRNISKLMFKEETYNKLCNYYYKTNKIFFSYISSQIIDAILVGIITSIAMLIMKVKYAVLLGFLIGLFNVIPYFGAIVAIAITIIITIFTGGILKALWLALVIIILQQIDANIINPKILGSSLNISRILIIFAVTVGGAYFGAFGMFLGVPVIAAIKIVLDDFIMDQNNKKKQSLE